MAGNLSRAKEIIDARREAAENAALQKRAELEAISPELRDVNLKISRAGLDAMKAISLGQNASEYIEKLSEDNLALQNKRAEILESFGLPSDALDIHYTCKKCEDTGVVDGYYCDCFKSIVKKLQHDNLCKYAPAEECTFGSFNLGYYEAEAKDRMTQIYNYCKAWAEDFDKDSGSILLFGKTGLGKTHLSLSIANVVVSKGYNVCYISAGNLFSRLEREQFGKFKSDESFEDVILDCDLLILDDLGSEFITSFTVAKLYNIINTRILYGLPTVISTNLLYDEIGDKYDPRVYSRIIGSYKMLECLGADIRQLKAD